ncbi:MAG: FKBP-type peptidyl-prolyl cis-trans isomerase [Bacteroidales bacterium]|nr:FKBP-type peptidyl-prolyl cis-trans isomerase [Bacteroidales bacterium]
MKKLTNAGIILLAIIALQSCNSISSKDAKLKTQSDSASYMIGISVGYSLKMQSVPDIKPELIAKGIEEVMNSDSTISAQEANMFLNMYFTQLREEKGRKNLEEGNAFLAENKNKEGVVETESGLQYKVLIEGTGKSPKPEDRVKCHYKGTLLNGEEFDSSYKLGQPAEFQLNRVISGWTEGLQLMKEGGKYELYIPSDLAYGPRGGQRIEPNMTLIFEIELLEVIPATNSNE